MSDKFLVLDIETLERPIPEELLAAARERISGEYVKKDTIEKHVNKWKDGWKFTRHGAQVLCVGFGVFTEEGDIVECFCKAAGDEETALTNALAYYQGAISKHFPMNPTPAIYHYNGDSFDLPILLTACVRNNLFPSTPFESAQFTDLMKYPYERFVKAEKLDNLLKLYNVRFSPSTFELEDFPNPDGSMVAEMWEKDKSDGGHRVEHYCLQDVLKTGLLAAKINQVIRIRRN